MKTIISLFLLTATSILQAAPQVISTPAQGKADPTPAPMLPLMAMPSTSSDNTRSVMSIDPKNRAMDMQQAYELLRREKTTAKVYFQLTNDQTISNVIDMNIMSNGSMILFRYNSPQGIKLQVVPIEDIASIGHQ